MKRTHLWLTVLATVLLGAALGASAWLVLRGQGRGAAPPEADPLRRFDLLIAREPLDEPLRPSVRQDAEAFLDAVLARWLGAGPKRNAARLEGAVARLAVIHGEAGHMGDREVSEADVGERFDHLLRCAYRAGGAGCVALFDGARSSETLADARARAGLWAGTRAFLTAAFNAGKLDLQRHVLHETEATLAARAAERWSTVLALGLVAAGIIAAFLLHRRPKVAPPPLPAPWTARALYASLVRCGLYALLATAAIGVPVALVRPEAVIPLLMAGTYLVGLWLLARLVFRRFGLSWRDGFRAGPGAATTALVAVTAIAADHAGRILVTLAALPFVDVAPRWSEIPSLLDQPLTAAGGVELATLVLLGPLVEEVLFRRVIFVFLKDRWGFVRGALAASLVFGLLHLYSPVATATIVWAGLVYTWALYRTGSLWPGFAAHAAANALALLSGSG